MWTSIQYIFLCAVRDRLFLGLAAGIALASLIASILGSTAAVESAETALVYAAGSARLMLAVGLGVFVCFHVKQGFETREIDVMLSRPLSRARLVIAFWAGFAGVASLLALLAALALLLIGVVNWPGFAAWLLTLLLEGWFTVALSLFAALVLRSAVSAVLATLGFYTLSRLMVFFLMTAEHTPTTSALLMIGKYSLTAVSALMPRLDFFAKTEWLAYGPTREWLLASAQAAIFIPLLLTAAVLDFRRKEF